MLDGITTDTLFVPVVTTKGTVVTVTENLMTGFDYDPDPLVRAMNRRKLEGKPSGVAWAARATGLSAATVSRVLNRNGASLAAVGKVCKALGVDPSEVQPAAEPTA